MPPSRSHKRATHRGRLSSSRDLNPSFRPLLIEIGKLPKISHHRAPRRIRRRPNPAHGAPSPPHPKPLLRRRSDPARRKRNGTPLHPSSASIKTKSALPDLSSPPQSRRIPLPSESLDAVGCFLQYLYTGEYFPRKLDDLAALEPDPAVPSIDDTGDQLLKHARVYTLADKLGLPDLKTLSHSKIHRISSTASAEIAYARYVYSHTPAADATIRKPVASFWGQRSHVLRHEAEKEFKQMCLEFPQFGFDVLSFVLDAKERRGTDREGRGEEPKSGRKRARNAV